MSNDTFVVVFPSLFAEKKIGLLMTNIKKILKIHNQNFAKISRDENLILIDASDPVFASTAINLLFGIKQIIIGKQTKNDFKTVVDEITKTGSSLLLKGEKFYVSVEGKTKGYLTKDVELSATSSIIEKNKKIDARPGTKEKFDNLLFTYITKTNAYISIFTDKGLGGTVNNSQEGKIVCGVADEFSALTCLATIKQGFQVKIVVFYQNHKQLVDLIKILQKLLPRTLQTNSEIEFYNVSSIGNDLKVRNLVFTEILGKIAARKKISHIALSVSPLVFESSFIKKLQIRVFEAGLIPHIPLSGIDSELFDNAKEIGLEKFVVKIETMLRKKTRKIVNKKTTVKNIAEIIKTKKAVKIGLGPNMLHNVLDTLKVKH